MTEKPIFLTPEGQRKLEEELEYLRTVRRPEVARRIHLAKEEGDIMEIATNGLEALLAAGESVQPSGKLATTWGDLRVR